MKLLSISLAWITGSILYALLWGYEFRLGIPDLVIWLIVLLTLILTFRWYLKKLL